MFKHSVWSFNVLVLIICFERTVSTLHTLSNPPEIMASVSMGRIQKLKGAGNPDEMAIFEGIPKRVFN